MPLPNRVDPFGGLFATPTRGTLFGNRGGKFHRDDKNARLAALGVAAVDLLCAEVQGPPARRVGPLLHRLFFLDEVTAFAAGHRPCFECRRRCRTICESCFQAEAARIGGRDGQRPPCRAVGRQGQANLSPQPRLAAGWCDGCARRRSLCRSRQTLVAVDTVRLFGIETPPSQS